MPASQLYPSSAPPLRGDAGPVASTASAIPSAEMTALASDQRGYDDGFARGLEAARAQAALEVQQRSAQIQEALAERMRELERRGEQQLQEHRQQIEQAYQLRIARVNELLSALPGRIESRIAAAEEDMLALSFEATCQILGACLSDSATVRIHLHAAMDRLRGGALVAVRLHPDDLAALHGPEAGPEVLAVPRTSADGQWVPGAGQATEAVQWIADPAIALGGFILESPEGAIDARMETQLRELARVLERSRGASRS